MTLPSSGPLSIGDIAAEFGGAAPHALSEYYGAGGAPASGPLAISDFYGRSANIDTGFVYGVYDGVVPKADAPTNPQSMFQDNNNATTFSTTSTSVVTSVSTGNYPAINAANIILAEVYYTLSRSQATVYSSFVMAAAADATGVPAGAGGIGDQSPNGEKSGVYTLPASYLGSSAAVLNYWKGGASITGQIRAFNNGTSLIRRLAIRVVYE